MISLSEKFARYSAILTLLACPTLLSACGGLGYTPPPGAKLGDGFLSLTISTNDRGRMPQGADVVISIEDATSIDPKKSVLIGDVIKLSMADPDVKVNFPIDRHILADCGKSKNCLVKVQIVKDGSVRYKSMSGHPYKAGQSKAKITVSRAT
jgi:hypothetical protein